MRWVLVSSAMSQSERMRGNERRRLDIRGKKKITGRVLWYWSELPNVGLPCLEVSKRHLDVALRDTV